MIKLWAALKILAEQFGIKLDLATVLKSRVFIGIIVALFVQWNGCKMASDRYQEGYADGCIKCGGGDVRPEPDDGGWYPFKHFKKFLLGATQPPELHEDFEPPIIENHPPVTEGETLEAPQ